MAVRRLAEDQPDSFAFTPENVTWAKREIEKFPEGRQASAVLALLWRAQEQHDGWLPEPAIRHVADFLEMPHIRVLEIATFYTMFNLEPVGEHFVQLCGTTPCMLRGANGLKEVCKKVIGPERQVTEDGKLSWLEVECLGACCNAPMVQINQEYYEDLTAESFEALLNDLREGRPVKPGPQVERSCSAPITGPTTLLDEALYKPKSNGKTPLSKPATAKPAAKPADKTPADASAKKSTASAAEMSLDSPDRPKALEAPNAGTPDDLKKISGIGPKIEGLLNELGIYHFAQIAEWNDGNKTWVDGYLKFKGRIDREDWIGQAKTLKDTGNK